MTAKRISALIAMVAMVVACQVRKDPALPTVLVGVWKTVSPQYADRFFEIAHRSIFFGTGDGNAEAYPIVAVDEVREANGVLYTISYRNHDGQEYRLSFYHDPSNAGVIRFKHQRNIQWTKARSSR